MNQTIWAEYHNKYHTTIRAIIRQDMHWKMDLNSLVFYRRFDYAGLLPIRSLTQKKVQCIVMIRIPIQSHQATTR